MKHPSEEALASHVEARDESIDQHVEQCRLCARILTEYESLSTALRDSAAWEGRTATPSGFEERGITSIHQERTAAALLAELSSVPVASWETRLPHHAGTVRSLITHAHNLIDEDPQRAHDIADLALRFTSHVADVREQHHLRGSAQRELANALRYLGRYPEALLALDEAETNFRRLPTGEFDLGSVFYVRSGILREQHRLADARDAVTESARIFAVFGESVRGSHALIAMANIDYEDGQFARAREQYEKLLGARALRDDEITLARLHQNLGCTLERLGEHGAAREQLKIARKTYERMGKVTEAARVQWALARTALAENDFSDAQDELWVAIAMLTEHGMRTDAALARLDLAEVLLERGDTLGARENCMAIVNDLVEAGMALPAASAMETLRQAAAADRVTVSVVRETRAILESLATS